MLVETLYRDGHRMGSKYQKSVRLWLPLCAITLEVIFIVIFLFFTSYSASVDEQKKLLRDYRGECPEGRWSQRQTAGTGKRRSSRGIGPPFHKVSEERGSLILFDLLHKDPAKHAVSSLGPVWPSPLP